MNTRFVCWCPDIEDDPGADPLNVNVVETSGLEWAAEEYAERTFHAGDPFETTTVMVRDGLGMVHTVEVTVEYDPTFSGRMTP